MAWTFNPFSGTFDQKGSGGGGGGSSYLEGEVQNFSALPTATPPAIDAAYLVREAEGTWLLSRKPAGIYIRVATTGTRASDWTYAGEFPDVFNDANFVVYNNTDSTKNVKFDVSAVATGTTRTITVPDRNVALPDQDLNTTDSPTFAGITATTWQSTSEQAQVSFADNFVEVINEEVLSARFKGGNGVEFPHGITLQDSTDATKQATFDVSGVTTETTRSLEIPDADGVIALVNDIPTTASDIGAAASGSITSSGLTQATARLIGRTSSGTGAVEEITVGSGLSLSAGELSATGGSGVTAVGASTADVLSVSGSDLVADDPNADRIIFWDDSESKLRYLEAGSGLSISGTTMTATSTFDPASPAGIGTTTPNTGAFTSLTGAPAANTAAYAVTGYSLTGSNAQSVIDLAGTWNTTGTPSAIKLNVTDTASNASSLLMQLQTGGTNRLTVNKSGDAVGRRFGGASHFFSQESGIPSIYHASVESLGVTQGSVSVRSAASIGFSTSISGAAADVRMWRDAAATWALRDDLNPQEMRCYGTFTSSTNYQRMTVKSVKQTLSALSGASATTTGTFIPDGAVVVGVTTRVGTTLTGATGYTIGDGTDADRWGDITGTAIGTTSDNANWTAGTIECFTAGGNVTLTANGSNFTAGAIEICVFYLAGQAD
jgi:hypothetical protein